LLTPVFYVLIRNFVERQQTRKAAKAKRLQTLNPEAH